jgi:hypothetical protein
MMPETYNRNDSLLVREGDDYGDCNEFDETNIVDQEKYKRDQSLDHGGIRCHFARGLGHTRDRTNPECAGKYVIHSGVRSGK